MFVIAVYDFKNVDRWISSFFHSIHIQEFILIIVHMDVPRNNTYREAIDGRTGT